MDSAVGKRLTAGWTTEGSEFENRQSKKFSLLQVVQTDSEAHRAYSMGIGSSFPGGKAAGADGSPPTNAKVKKMWIYTSTPHTLSWCSA
jgi:hypothetical protein